MKIKGGRNFTCHVLHDKEKRSLAIIELLRRKGVISRTEISKTTGVNIVSTSNYINHFLEKKIVLEKGHAESTGGRKPELVELNARQLCAVGVDMRPDGTSVVLADMAMNVIARKEGPTPEYKKDMPDAVTGLIEAAIGASGIPAAAVKAIGIGVASENYAGVGDAVEKKFGADTFVGSRELCGAFAEKRLNKEAGVEKLLYMYSDAGCGILIDDENITGCGCGPETAGPEEAAADTGSSSAEKTKYLRPWSGYLGVVEMAKREVSRGVGTKIVHISGGDMGKITEMVVMEAARQGDETALNIIHSVAIMLGLRMAYLINLFGPGAVVVGGGPEKATDLTFPLIDKMVKRLSLKKYTGTVKIIPSALGEDGLCLGASALAIREALLKS